MTQIGVFMGDKCGGAIHAPEVTPRTRPATGRERAAGRDAAGNMVDTSVRVTKDERKAFRAAM